MGSACVTEREPLIEQRLYLKPLPRKRKVVQADDTFTDIESAKSAENLAHSGDSEKAGPPPIESSGFQPEKAPLGTSQAKEAPLETKPAAVPEAQKVETIVEEVRGTAKVVSPPRRDQKKQTSAMAGDDHGEVQPVEALDFENE